MASKQASKPAPEPKKGRNPIAPAKSASPQLDPDSLEQRGQELQLMAKAEAEVRALAASIGYGGALDIESLWSMVEYRQRRSVEDILEMGRGLLLLKEQTPHGAFQEQAASRGIQPRTAQRLMGVALKFSKSDSVTLLKAAGTQAKVLELAVLDDEEVEALSSGEPVAGITLDDVERMSASELRRSLRDARADLDAKDQRVTKLSEDLNKAEEKTVKAQRKWKAATPDEQLATLQQRVTEAELDIVAKITSEKNGLCGAVIDLAEHCTQNDLDSADFLGAMFGRLLKASRTVRDDYEYGFAIPVVADKGA